MAHVKILFVTAYKNEVEYIANMLLTNPFANGDVELSSNFWRRLYHRMRIVVSTHEIKTSPQCRIKINEANKSYVCGTGTTFNRNTSWYFEDETEHAV